MTLVHARNDQHSSPQGFVNDSGLASANASASFSTSTFPTSIEAWLEQTSSQPPTPATRNNTLKRKLGETSWSLPGSSPPHTPLGVTPWEIMEPGQNLSQAPVTPPQSHTLSNPPPPSTVDSKSTQASESKPPKDAYWIGRRLRSYNLFQNEQGSLQRYPKFEKLVQTILDNQRDSIVNPDSARKFSEVHQYYERTNEDTFLQNVLPTIIKSSRKVKSRVRDDTLESNEEVQKEHTEELDGTNTHGQIGDEDEEEPEYIVQSFWDDGLGVKMNCEFRKSFLSGRDKDEELAKAMAKVDGMTNPKPDYTYGLRIDQYSIPDGVTVSAYTDFLLEVVPILHHPFFIIEGKSDSGFKAEAENQVCRGGATLVNAARQLLERIGAAGEDETGPDQRTFVYSATLSSGLMDVWVHWAEVRPIGAPIFHMHRLESISLNSTGAVGKLRRITHNILDWGCVNRSPKIREVYDRIFAFEGAKKEERRKQLDGKKPIKKRKGIDGPIWS